MKEVETVLMLESSSQYVFGKIVQIFGLSCIENFLTSGILKQENSGLVASRLESGKVVFAFLTFFLLETLSIRLFTKCSIKHNVNRCIFSDIQYAGKQKQECKYVDDDFVS